MTACSGSKAAQTTSLPATTQSVQPSPATAAGTSVAATTRPDPGTSVPATPEPGPSAGRATAAVVDFSGAVAPVTAADLPSSWRPGCPVGPDELRLLTIAYWGFDDQPHAGALVVHAGVAESVLGVFEELYRQRFPISRMEPVEAFGGDDDASMAADNTSSFNCRYAVAPGPPRWSRHAYGRAIDVNPVENPYLLGGEVLPPAGAAYIDRDAYRVGMAVDGGPLTSAFAAAGWSWGGHWAAPDYQHFQAPQS